MPVIIMMIMIIFMIMVMIMIMMMMMRRTMMMTKTYPNGKSKITNPHHASDEAKEVESTLLSTGHHAVL